MLRNFAFVAHTDPSCTAVLYIVCALIGLAILYGIWRYVGALIAYWFQANKMSGAPVSFLKLVSMRLRGVKVKEVMVAYILAHRGGRHIPVDELELRSLAGVNVLPLAVAVVMASRHGVDLTWEDALKRDAAGEDVRQTVSDAIAAKADQENPANR